MDRFGDDDQDDTISVGPPVPPVPPPPRGGWNWRPPRAATFAGVAVIALAAGAGVGYSATSSSPSPASDAAAAASSPSPAPTPSVGGPGKNRHGHGWIGFGGPFGSGRAGIGGGVLHGQFTVPKQGGGYETLDVQRGTATAVSGNSISVKSSDGYTAAYTVTRSTIVDAQADGISSVKKGDTVMVAATAGSTPTAASIADITAIKAGRASLHLPAQSVRPSFMRPAAAPPAGT